LRVVGDRRLRAGVHLDPARFQRLGHDALQADMQQAVVQVRALDHDMVGEHEPALERAAGDAAIQHLVLLRVVGRDGRRSQRVVLDREVEFLGPEAGHRHGQAVVLVAESFSML
jgi:hypothetical protein